VQRGEIFALPSPRRARGHEQQGRRYGVVVQNDALLALSTVVVAPTSSSARPATFRPEIEVDGASTRVLVEQLSAVDASRLGESVGYLQHGEMREVDRALSVVLGLAT
jgi:mRNA interferase MazF